MKFPTQHSLKDDAASESQRRAEEFAALYEASRDLAAQTGVAALLDTLLQWVTSLLGSSSTSVFLYDEKSRQVEVAATARGSIQVGMRFALNEGIIGRVVATGEPIIVDDYQTWEHRLPGLAADGVRAIMMVPMATGGERIGALGVSEYSTARKYSEADAHLLSLFAAQAASALRAAQHLEAERARSSELLRDNLERRRIEEALRRSEERFRSLVEDMNDVVFTVGFDGVITYISPAVQLLTGHSADAMAGRPFTTFVHPDDVAGLGAALERVLQDRREPIEFRVFSVDGAIRWVRSSSRRHVVDGVAVGITGSLTDVTERRHAETALQESETRYRQLVELSPDGVAVHSDGKLTFVNSASVRMVGADSPAEVLGRSVLDFVHPDDRAVSVARIRRIHEGQVPVERAETRLLQVDGSVREVELVVMPLSPEEARGVQVVMHDITERKRASRALAESEARYRELVENANDLIYVHDLDGNFLSMNRAGEQATGYTREEVTTRNVADLVAPEDLPRAIELMKGISVGRELPLEFESDIVTKDGRRVTLEISPRVMLRNGVAVAVQGVARDVTDRKRAAEEIRILNEELERRVQERTAELAAANRELEAFGYSVAHDLRGPLRLIDGFSQLLLDEQGSSLDEASRGYLQHVRTSSHRMAELIQALLNLSRVTRHAIVRKPVDLGAVAREVAAQLDRSQPERDVEFVIPRHLPVSGDASMLRIVIENLLGNAWKYTSMHRKARVELGVREQQGEIVYFVRDDGAGFDMEYASKLFQPFQRLHHVSEFEGTGIGLTTVERIVRRHGGRVWAESSVEQGATFYFTLAPGKES